MNKDSMTQEVEGDSQSKATQPRKKRKKKKKKKSNGEETTSKIAQACREKRKQTKRKPQ